MKPLAKFSLGCAMVLLVLPQAVLAGMPLTCFPFDIGGAKSLPWGGTAWHEAKADYNLQHLVPDTLALLTPETPVIVRMETLRRAAIYARSDDRLAQEVLWRLKARVTESEAKGKPDALALFDQGYLAETQKQLGVMDRRTGLAGIDGHALVVKAIGLRGGDPEMEFAAALMNQNTRPQHLQKATAGAKDGSLLARNLASHFGK